MSIIVPEGDAISIFQDFKKPFLFPKEISYLHFPSQFTVHTYLASECLCLKDIQKSEKSLENCLATQNCHRYRQEGLAFESVGQWIQTKSKSRNLAVSHWQTTVVVLRERAIQSGSQRVYHSMDYTCHNIVYTMRICHSTNHCHLL